MRLSLAVVLVSLATCHCAEDQLLTVITTEGVVYDQAQITELRPTGVVLKTHSGIAVVPYRQLPKDLAVLYGSQAELIGNSLSGIHEMPREQTAFGGERIILKGDEFVYQWASDVSGGGELRRRLIRKGHWITFHSAEFPFPDRVLAVVAGKLTVMIPDEFKVWRETGDITLIQKAPLHRIRSD